MSYISFAVYMHKDKILVFKNKYTLGFVFTKKEEKPNHLDLLLTRVIIQEIAKNDRRKI